MIVEPLLNNESLGGAKCTWAKVTMFWTCLLFSRNACTEGVIAAPRSPRTCKLRPGGHTLLVPGLTSFAPFTRKVLTVDGGVREAAAGREREREGERERTHA